jgi:hypothetical protein
VCGVFYLEKQRAVFGIRGRVFGIKAETESSAKFDG